MFFTEYNKASMDTQLASNNDKMKEASFKRSISKQVLLALLTNFSNIGPSMALGFSAIAIPYLKNTLNEDEISWFASIAALAAPFGCFFSGPIADRFGRRFAIICINIICFLGWLMIYTAYSVQSNQYLLLLMGRLFTGFSVGLASFPATIYMAEVSSSNFRGVFTTWGSIFFSLGILMVYTLGFVLKESWGLIALITCIFPCLSVIFLLFFVPESPSWLVGKNRLEEAKINISQIFGTKDCNSQVQSELKVLIKAKGIKKNTKQKPLTQQMMRKIKYLVQPNCLKPFSLVFVYFFFQQFSGTFVIVFYALDIVENAGVSLDPYLAIVMIGLIRLTTAIFVSCVSKNFGRRPLSIASGIGMSVCMLSLAVYNLTLGGTTLQYQGVLKLLPLMFILFYFFTSTLGFLTMPFALAAELFPTKISGTANGLLTGFGSLFNFVAVKLYPRMVDDMKATGVFFFYGSMALVGTVFVALLLPETRGKSLQEILKYFGQEEEIEDEGKKLEV